GKEGVFNLIIEPLPLACFLDEVGSSASIFSAETGHSFLNGKLGKRVASECVSLVDDARLPNGYSSTEFDEEGVPTRANKILEHGVFKTFLHNTSTAVRYKTKTTASAGLVSPSAHNLVLDAGELSSEELLQEAKNGLLITNTWYTRFQNYEKGEFSTIPRDAILEIKNGKIAGAVQGIRITDSMLNILKNTGALEKQRKQIVSWEADTPVLAPSVLVKGVRVTCSSQ
ncbi:MAG: metallopeptidase TldD-related protein, partial [Candidatus Micrarchaeota archaeon]